MGARIFKQPNGKYLRWSYNVDCPTHYNMTIEEYRNYRLEKAKEEIEKDIQDIFYKNTVYKARDFDKFMKEDKHMVYNMNKKDFAKFLKDISSTLTVADFTFPEDLKGEY